MADNNQTRSTDNQSMALNSLRKTMGEISESLMKDVREAGAILERFKINEEFLKDSSTDEVIKSKSSDELLIRYQSPVEPAQDYTHRMERVEKNNADRTRQGQTGEAEPERRQTRGDLVKYRGKTPPPEEKRSQKEPAGGEKNSDPTELERFKTEINLSEYAASAGYRLSPRESYKNVAVMRSDDGGKINVTVKDGHYVYYDWRTEKGGSIVDFVQNTKGVSLGDVRKELRPWINEHKPSIESARYQHKITPTEKDTAQTIAHAQRLEHRFPAYLAERGIDAEIMTSGRFAGTVYSDPKGNAVFPHINRDGLSGLELHNKGFKHFVNGGEKAVWFSRVYAADNRLVVTESPIDALSYHQLKGDDHTRYVSFGGNMSDRQKDLLQSAIRKMPENALIIAATDKDKAGDGFAEQIKAYASEKRFLRDTPEIGKDWNDQLKHTLKITGPVPTKSEGQKTSQKLEFAIER